ncbi:MAG TPA: NADH-quinone oxidoreductase subunit N [Bacillota bacterium]
MNATPLGNELLVILPEIVLLAFALLALIWAQFLGERAPGRIAAAAALGTVLALASLFFAAQAASGPVLFGAVAADGFSVFIRAVLYAGALLVILGGAGYIRRFGVPAGEFYSLFLLAMTGGGFMAAAANVLTFYVGLELLSLSSYALAGLRLDDPDSNEASLKYFLNGAVSSAILLFGLSWLFGLTGTLDLAGTAAALASSSAHPALIVTAVTFVVAGLGFKMATVPFHLWVPDVYQGAPTPVTAFLSVGSKGAALAAALRLFYEGMGPLAERWTVYFALLAAVTMTWGNVSGLLQRNIKRMLGYSSIAHAGYLLVGLAAGSEQGVWAAMFYLLAYTFTNLGAFTVVMVVRNSGGAFEIDGYAGLARRNPFVAGAMTVFFLSLIGFPFTAGFFGKLYLIGAAVNSGLIWLAVLTAINSVISVGYYYGVVRNMYLRESDTEQPAVTLGGSDRLATALALVMTLGIGIVPQFLSWAQASALFP